MAVMTPHTYEGEEYQIILQSIPDSEKFLKCTVLYKSPLGTWQYEFKVSPEFSRDPMFKDWACRDVKERYEKRHKK